MQEEKYNKKNIREIGKIISFFSGVGKIEGFTSPFVNELITDENQDPIGIVFGFDEGMTEAVFFEEDLDFSKPVFASNTTFSIPFSSKYLGRVVNGLGVPIDGKGYIRAIEKSIFTKPIQIKDRQEVSDPLVTGIKIIDSTLPLGRGQRQLILGDRKLGKSTIAVDTILNQKNSDVPLFCIYVITGKKERELKDLVSLFKKTGAFEYSIIVAATANATLAEQYLSPFIGTTIAEYFRDSGKDALVVYDDLTNHAKAYRSISLLLKRPPGREVYPGDIFSIHAKLLERSAKIDKKNGNGSLSSFPIVEIEEGDITSYIATNLISITDGQIYLEGDLFQKDFLPAINIGLSVSRIGAKAQPIPLKEATRALRLSLAQQRELQKLVQIETTISKETLAKMTRGNLILSMLKQGKHTNITWQEQTALFQSVTTGLFDDLKVSYWPQVEKLLLNYIRSKKDNITSSKGILELIKSFKEEFLTV